MSVLTECTIKRIEFRGNVGDFFSPGTNQTVRDNEVSVKRGSAVL